MYRTTGECITTRADAMRPRVDAHAQRDCSKLPNDLGCKTQVMRLRMGWFGAS
ncbi:MAG: hypothetical protein JRJ00_09885 [Deltaproteobacteria bacterium]|nr:hypothetical protein [Deltaproteobacteria bacterium]